MTAYLLTCVAATLHFIGIQASHIKEMLSIPDISPVTTLVMQGKKVWHDTYASILAIHPVNAEQAEFKNAALKCWLVQGFCIGLNVSTESATPPKGASQLSTERRYWKIPKQCFWRGCACSASFKPPHQYRVCKGCWRVLYCSKYCQRS